MQVFWTEKNKLNRIIDPLSLSDLKVLEDEFLVGITTQTDRLRYFSFLTWAWYTIKKNDLSFKAILPMEKVFTLICAYHHLQKEDYPRGIRNRQDAEAYLLDNNFINVEKFTKFGRNNRVGYGQYYYHGPLNTLKVFWGDNNKIVFSQAGEKIAALYAKTIGKYEELFVKGEFAKDELNKMIENCACQIREGNSEIDLWRKILFGFTKNPLMKQDLIFDEEKFNEFMSGNYKFPENINDDKIRRKIMLFTVMKIIDEINPSKQDLEQSIRDAFYFEEYDHDGKISSIDYGQLAKIKKQREVYVHNLYYTDILEYIFTYILEVLEKKTLGATLNEILGTIDLEKIGREIYQIFKERGIEPKKITPKNIMKAVESLDISLKDQINEKTLFLEVLNSKDSNFDFSRIVILLFLLRKRYNLFDEEQRQDTGRIDDKAARPSTIYEKIENISLPELFRLFFSTIINLHRYISARKYMFDGTKSWLFTLEEDKLFYYGKFYRFRPYRESKWTNTVEMLYDMNLVDFDGNYRLTEDGKKWLSKIQ